MKHRGRSFRFADVEVREGEFSVRKDGQVLPVEPKAYKVLEFLLSNPGRVVSKNELLDAVWSDVEVSESSLTRAIAILRRLLGDDVHEQRFIATVATVGYRFVAPVEVVEDPSVEPAVAVPAPSEPEVPAPAPPTKRWPKWWWAAGGAPVLLAVIALLLWHRSLGQPVVEAVTQLTDDGNPKTLDNPVVSDGSRIYFGEMQGSREIVAQVASTGGQTGVIDSGIEAPRLMDLAPDSSSLLIGDEHHHPGLYLLPLPAGEHRRLSGFEQFWRGCFAPGGGFYLSNNRSLYAGDPEGTQVRKLLDFSNVLLPYRCTATPDGTSIRVSVFVGPFTKVLWDVSSDGRSAHPFLPGWQSGADTCCGRSTADGKYFVFQSRMQGRADLWVTRERRSWFERASSPMRLTNGPLSYEQPFPSRDGKHIYVLGLKKRGELVRYDSRSGQFAPYLSGISAIDATVSSDGKWIAYLSFPDHNLWRVRADGSERLQLTYPPTSVYVPRISPDGTKVAYTDVNSGAISVVSMDGGVPRKVEDTGVLATWSPDSHSLLLYGSEPNDPSKRMETIDLSTGKVSVVPDCSDKCCPYWPSENLILAAAPWNGAWSFVTLDLKTKKWSHLVSAPFNHWMPSVDGKYLYYTTAGDNPKIFRVRFSDGKVEEIASLKNFRPVEDENIGSWVGVTADGDPLLTRDIGTQEIYDLSVRWP